MISVKQKGNFKKTDRFLKKWSDWDCIKLLNECGRKGAEELANATPVDSGLTSKSWDYIIEMNEDGYSIHWTNENVVDGFPIALLIQYGHGTGSGTYVTGVDYINPALTPVFDQFAERIWKELNQS